MTVSILNRTDLNGRFIMNRFKRRCFSLHPPNRNTTHATKTILILSVIGLFLFFPASYSTAAIEVLDTYRNIYSEASLNEDRVSDSLESHGREEWYGESVMAHIEAEDGGMISFVEAFSTQTSSFNLGNQFLHVGVSGSVGSLFDLYEDSYGEPMTENYLEISFSLDSNSNYYLEYSLFEFAGLNLYSSSNESILRIFEGGDSIEGTLGPGTYAFGVFATESGDFDVSFSVQSVPVPAAFWLLGSGLVGLVSIRRCKR